MKYNIIIAILSIGIFSFSCDPLSNENIENDGIIGTWRETLPKSPVYDSSGLVVIDSIDVSAIFEFHQDSSFNAMNDYWTSLTHGTWEFDSINSRIYLYPIDDDFPTFYRKDIWKVLYMDEFNLKVGHQFDHFFPGDSSAGAIYRLRNFKRL